MGTGVYLSGAFQLTVSLPAGDDATRTAARRVLTAASRQLFGMTGGQIRLGTVYLAVHPTAIGTADVRFRDVPGASRRDGIGKLWQTASVRLTTTNPHEPDGCAALASPEPDLDAPPNVVAGVLHELSHYAFGLADEYFTPPGGKATAGCRCLMACKSVWAYCDAAHDPHAGPAPRWPTRSCWEIIAARYGVARPTQSGYCEAPGPCPPVEFVDVERSAQVLVATYRGVAPATQAATDVVAWAWRQISGPSGGQVQAPEPLTDDPMIALTGATAWMRDARRLSSQNILLLGSPMLTAAQEASTPTDRTLMRDLVRRLLRGKATPVHVVSPIDVSDAHREFALQSGGSCEVVTAPDVTGTGDAAAVDLRTRALVRLGSSVEGFGIGLLRRYMASPQTLRRHVVHVETGAAVAAFVLIQPPGGTATLRVRDPLDVEAPVARATDGSIQCSVVAAPRPRDWRVEIHAGAATAPFPVAVLGLIENHDVWIRASQPRVDGHHVAMTFNLSHELQQLEDARLADATKPIPITPATPEAAGESAEWNDGTEIPYRGGSLVRFERELDGAGNRDFHVDYRLSPKLGDDMELVRIIPFQLHVAPASLPSRTRTTS